MKSGPRHNEKRDFTRMAIKSELTFSISDTDTTGTGSCKDLSHTGMYFVTNHPLSQGQTLEITIDTKNSNFEPMKAAVEIVRVSVKDNQYYVGCRILEFR